METMPLVEVSEAARTKIIEIRDQEPTSHPVALFIEVTGVRGNAYAYDLSFVPISDARPDDHRLDFDGLTLIIPGEDAQKLRGSALDFKPEGAGLVMNNPNTPSPTIEVDTANLEGTVEERISMVLQHQINPAIAMHGGSAELVSVDGETAYLRLLGGCQGCGMAAVTLRQGIEQALLASVPEISRVADVTDHEAGENPYYQAAAK